MKVGFYQFVPEFGNVQKNVETMVDAVKAADADLVVFPELATSGYLFLDPKEVEAAVAAGAEEITLGRRILRTETAGIALIAALMIQLE